MVPCEGVGGDGDGGGAGRDMRYEERVYIGLESACSSSKRRHDSEKYLWIRNIFG